MFEWLGKSTNYRQKIDIKQNLPRASAILLASVLLVILFNVATMMSASFSDKSAPQAIKGEIDLTRFELADVGSVPLAGNWAFYWQQLLNPKQIASGQHTPFYSKVPHAWVRETIDGKAMPKQGVATYQVKVTTQKVYPHLALKVPTIGTAYKLFIDGKLVSQAGQVSAVPSQSKPGYNTQILFFEPQSSQFTITVQVSNHDYYWGGIWSAFRLGESQNLQQQQNQETLRSTFLLAIFLTVALLNLIQFTLRTADPLPIIIALTCLLLSLREIESSQVLHLSGISNWSFFTNTRINFLTFYLTTPLMVAYFHISFWREYKKSLMLAFYLICGLASLLVLFASPAVFSETMPFFQAFTIIFMPYVFWGLIQAVRYKRQSARLLTLGTLFLFALVLNDILYNLDIIDTGLMVSFGLVAFILCQNYLTYIRFIDAGMQNEVLSQTLEERNQELQNFSQSLEQKVATRTEELAKANEKLGELANQDMLTGLPNRRGMMLHIEESMVQYRHTHTPFCLLILDFDKFKLLNDNLGHEVGDQVLTQGATHMRSTLRNHDHLARWGGEEFLILLPGTPITGAEIIANKVKNSTRDLLTKSIGTKVSVTIGVAEFTANDTLATCLKRADKALYKGKNQGRDRVILAKQLQ